MAGSYGDLDLAEIIKRLEQDRTSAVGGIQALGSGQDQNIQNIYGNLRGGLQQNANVTEGIYSRGIGNVQSAYGMGGQQAGAAAARSMGGISDFAGRLGMDSRALGEVQGKLALQAGQFGQQNQQSMMDRTATMAQEGAGQTAISQMAVAAASQAEAQGRKDLSTRILTEIAKANTSAASGKAGATSAAAANAAREANASGKELISKQEELLHQQRAQELREAKSENPLDEMIKMLRIQNMEEDLDPSSTRRLMQELQFEELMDKRKNRNAESMSDVFNDIQSRFPNGGRRTIPLLQEAIQKNEEADDVTGQTARKHVMDNAGNLDLRVVLDQLERLQKAAENKARR